MILAGDIAGTSTRLGIVSNTLNVVSGFSRTSDVVSGFSRTRTFQSASLHSLDEALLESIPVWVIRNDLTALYGAARVAVMPLRSSPCRSAEALASAIGSSSSATAASATALGAGL